MAKISFTIDNKSEPFEFNPQGLTDEEVITLREKYGWNEHKEKIEPTWKKILRRYLSLVPIILMIAAVLSVSIKTENTSRDWLSFSLLFFLINLTVWADYFGERSAQNAIHALEALSPTLTFCKRNNCFVEVNAKELVPGDVVKLKGGVVIPADGIAFSILNSLQIDESALTGESLPVTKRAGSTVLSGSIVQRGEGEMVVTSTGINSFFGKTIALLGKAETPGHLRSILDTAAKIITMIAFSFAIFLFFWVIFQKDYPADGSSRGLLGLKIAFVLVASVTPAAMPVVTTTVLAVGARIMSREQAIVNRLSAIEEAAGIEILCSDKTGTLTKNELSIYEEETVCQDGVSPDYLFMLASLASTIEEHAEPIDQVINKKVDMNIRAKYTVLSYLPFNPVDKRTESHVVTPDSKHLLVTKGAPHIIRDMVAHDNEEFKEYINKIILAKAEKGLRTLGIASCIEGSSEWKLLGYISMFDPPREDTKETLAKSIEMGIEVKMITGDQQAIAVETARQLGIGTNIVGPEVFSMKPQSGTPSPFLNEKSFADFILKCNGFAGMYPEHKFSVVNSLLARGYLVGMTGDGVNDAPALKLATVGIAVAGATEAAKAAADIVLLKPGLSSIIKAFSLSRKIFKRIESYITFRIYTSVFILMFIWSTTVFINFRFPSWTLVLISLINDFTLMSCAYDHVPTSSSPLRWSMKKVTIIAVWMSTLSTVFAILYVVLSDPSFNINWWSIWNVPNFIPREGTQHSDQMSDQTNAGVWLLLTLLIQLSFHSCRTNKFFLIYNKDTNKRPSIIIIILQTISLLITFFLSIYWQENWKFGSGSTLIGLTYDQALITVLYAVVCFALTDLAKVAAYNARKLRWNELTLVNLFTGDEKLAFREKQRIKIQKMINEEMDKRFITQTGGFNLTDKLEAQKNGISLALMDSNRRSSITIQKQMSFTYGQKTPPVKSSLDTYAQTSKPLLFGEDLTTRLIALENAYDGLYNKLNEIEKLIMKNK